MFKDIYFFLTRYIDFPIFFFMYMYTENILFFFYIKAIYDNRKIKDLQILYKLSVL